MVRIARAPGNPSIDKSTPDRSSFDRSSLDRETADRRDDGNREKYDYPDRDDKQVTAYRQAANQPPQLNFPQNNRLAQCNCNGVSAPPQNLQYPPQNFGNYNGYQAPQQAFQPQAGYAAPGYAGAQPGYPLQAGIGVPQFNQTGGNWWTPFVSGSGYYTPLLNFRNMPAGTYLGQGIIGQPTAYVDGQPLRNLLRYISP